jgi:signal transduction histidine kinase
MTAQPVSHSQDQFISKFLSLVTHELRSPLNAINGYLDLMLEGMAGELSEQQREFLQRARAGSEHLYTLLEDLLLAARADTGQLRLKRTTLSLDEVVEAAMEDLELTTRDAGVTIETMLPVDLPPFLGDAVRLQHALRNLLSNALRFTPAGGRVTISAHLLPSQDGGTPQMIEIRVQDTGYGIAPEYHERIFERFFRGPQPGGDRVSGQGLGLAVVRIIAELHGGSVRVESTPGEGSTFVLALHLAGTPLEQMVALDL